MQLNGLGLYQSNTLANPWSNTVATRPNFKPTTYQKPASAQAGALSSSKGVAPLVGRTVASTGRPIKIDGAGDEVSVSPTSSTRAEVSRANLHAQTAQAAVTTANAVNDSLSKTELVLGGMGQIVSTLNNPGSLSASHRRELAGQFGKLADFLDKIATEESFAGHQTLDGKFRATFSVAGETKVTIDATLPNGKGFTTEGLGLKGFAGFLAAHGAHLNPIQGEAIGKGVDIARSAVSQVRTGLTQAAESAVEAMTHSSPLMSPEVQGKPETAAHLAAQAKDSILNSARVAYRAQANTAASSALRLLS